MKTHRRMASAIRLHAFNLLGSIKVPMGTIPRVWFFFMERLTSYSVFINGFFRVASIFVLLYLIRKDESSAYKIAWIILVMGLPLFGGILYLLIGNKKPSKNLAVHMAEVKGEMSEETRAALRRNGRVYFAAVGGAGAAYGNAIRKMELVAFPDLLSEAIYRMEVVDFPLVVAIDSLGNSVYDR